MITGENIFRNWIFGFVLFRVSYSRGCVGSRVTGKSLLLVAHYTPSCGVPAWVRKGSGCDLERSSIEHKGPLRLSHFSDHNSFQEHGVPSSYDLSLHRACPGHTLWDQPRGLELPLTPQFLPLQEEGGVGGTRGIFSEDLLGGK